MKKNKIIILMSTYNGEAYLAMQLNSIRAQSEEEWVLIIRDDGSSDQTLAILKAYTSQDNRIILLNDKMGNLKIQQSMSVLMSYALQRSENYIFFADQDDIWLPNKIFLAMQQFKKLEETHINEPLLIHTDLQVVDKNLNLIHPSFLKYEKLTRNIKNPLKTLLINNYVTGCTMAINRALLKIAAPLPNSALMHDWWCALCAATMGKIGFIEQTSMLYRQHDGNTVGSKGIYKKLKQFIIQPKKSIKQRIQNLRRTVHQAGALLNRMEEINLSFAKSNTINSESLTCFSNLLLFPIFERYKIISRLQLAPASRSRMILLWLMLGFL